MNLLQNKWIQMIIVFAVIFGLLIVIGMTFNIQLGAGGFHFSVDRT